MVIKSYRLLCSADFKKILITNLANISFLSTIQNFIISFIVGTLRCMLFIVFIHFQTYRLSYFQSSRRLKNSRPTTCQKNWRLLISNFFLKYIETFRAWNVTQSMTSQNEIKKKSTKSKLSHSVRARTADRALFFAFGKIFILYLYKGFTQPKRCLFVWTSKVKFMIYFECF